MLTLLLLGCLGTPAFEPYVGADAGRDGLDGRDGPFGAAFANRRYPARVIDRVDVELMLPVDADGAFAAPDAPTVVFVQGGAVVQPRYRWLAAHLATRGYAVLSPHHALDLAIFNIGNAVAALDGANDDPELAPWVSTDAAVAGHSLGGVVAVKNWLVDERFGPVVLLASYPAAGDDPADRAGSPVLSIAGATDGSAALDDVEAGFDRFEAPRWFALVDDLNHYGWTDGATPEELAGDGPVDDLPAARAHALAVLDAFLDATLRDDAEAAQRLDEPFEGVTVSR